MMLNKSHLNISQVSEVDTFINKLNESRFKEDKG